MMITMMNSNAEAVRIEINSDSFDQVLHDIRPNIVIFDQFITEEQVRRSSSTHTSWLQSLYSSRSSHLVLGHDRMMYWMSIVWMESTSSTARHSEDR